MRILILCSARNWGGNEKWTAIAAQALATRHTVHTAYRVERVGARLAGLDGVTTVRWPFFAATDPWTLTQLVAYIYRHRIDVLMPTKRKDYWLAGLAAQWTGVRNVPRLGIVRNLYPWSHHRWVYGRWADGMVVNAEPIRERIVASGLQPTERVAVIPNGVDRPKLEAAAEQAVPPPFSFTVVTVGKLTARKDLTTLLQGFAKFRLLRPSAGLIVLGEGAERSRLESLAAALGIAAAVEFRGFEEDPYPTLASAHAFVTTARNEGFANTVIEALYLGLPVITTAAGGALQWLTPGQDCLGIPMGEPAALAAALTELHDDPAKAHSLAASGYARARSLFSTQRSTQRLETFLAERLSAG